MDFPGTLKKSIDEAGMKPSKIAKAGGLKPNTLRSIMRGVIPKPETFQKITDGLDGKISSKALANLRASYFTAARRSATRMAQAAAETKINKARAVAEEGRG